MGKDLVLAEAGSEGERALDVIEVLPVSPDWKHTFAAIEQAGYRPSSDMIPRFENERALQLAGAHFNWTACLFSPLYYFVKGMHKKGLSLFLAYALFSIVPFAGIYVMYVAGRSANVDYYRKLVRGEEFWW